MALLKRILVALWPHSRRGNREHEMDAELRFHLERQIEEHTAAGMSPDEARRRARIEFGGLEQVKEEIRDTRRLHLLDEFLQDIRFALRILRKSPGFAAVAVLTLALGIGANTAIFSIVDAVIFRSLPYPGSSRIVSVYTKSVRFPTFNLRLSWPAFREIRSQASSLEQSAVYLPVQSTLTGNGSPTLLRIANVSQGFFEELGARPQLGRLLTDQDQEPGQNHVIILSDALWRTRFAADPSVVGRMLVLDREPWTIVGVAARGFSFPEKEEAWRPLSLSPDVRRNQTFFMLQFVGKLRPGRTSEQLNAELATIAQRIAAAHPELRAGYTFSTKPLLEERIGNVRTAYFVLLGATTLVLLICCANLASLLLARGAGRQREMAVRTALGASHGRLLRQGLAESCLLALFGGGLGVALAAGGVQTFRSIAPADTPRLAEISVDSTLLWFSLLTSAAAGLLFGLAPARRASHMHPSDALKEGSGAALGSAHSARQTRLGSALVVVEVALAFVLLIGSALMAQTVSRLLHQSPGFRTDHLLTFDLPKPPAGPSANAEQSAYAGVERLEQIIERVRSVPGVAAVTATGHGLLDGMMTMQGGLEVGGALPARPGVERHATTRYVYPSYFRILGIPLVRGREFTERSSEKSPMEFVVNETMAREYWGTLDVVGRQISVSRDKAGKPIWGEVVGVATDAREVRIASQSPPEYYCSLLQRGTGDVHLLVRTSVAPETLQGAISRRLWSLFPDQPISHMATMTRVISDSVGDKRLRSLLLGIFASIGLGLALVGAYGVISFSVARRVQEIGIRVALGARPAGILLMVLRQGLFPVVIGVAVGAAAALALTRVIASQLYGIQPTDPFTFLGAALLVLLVACVACYIPARRATRVDPCIALRYE